MTRDIVDNIDVYHVGLNPWSPTNHYVYVKKDDSIKSVTLSGATLDLAGPGYDGTKQLGSNGRLLYCGKVLGCHSIGADGSNPISYSSAPTTQAEMSPTGTMIVFAPNPDASKSVPIYAASSDSLDVTLVTLLSQQLYTPFWRPIQAGDGLVFYGVDDAGWIVPTADGFKVTYAVPVLGYIGWAGSLE